MAFPAKHCDGAAPETDEGQIVNLGDQHNEAPTRDDHQDQAAGVVPGEYLILPAEAGYFDQPDSGWFSMTEEEINALYGTVMTGVDTNPPNENDDQYINELYTEPYSHNFAATEPLAETTPLYPKIKNMRQDLDLNLFLNGALSMSDECWEKWQQDNFETDSEDEDWNEKYRPKNYVKRRDTKVAEEVFERISRDFPMFYPSVNTSATTQLSQRPEVSESERTLSDDGDPGRVLIDQNTRPKELLRAKNADNDKGTGANIVIKPEEKVVEPKKKLPVRRSPRKHRSDKPYIR